MSEQWLPSASEQEDSYRHCNRCRELEDDLARLTKEVAYWRHLYESQHMPKHEGFRPVFEPKRLP